MLRDVLGMTGTKFGCGMALCGACTVHVDGVADALLRHAARQRRPAEVTTIEAIGAHRGGRQGPEGLAGPRGAAVRLLPVRPDHVRGGAAAATPSPTDADIDAAMSGNICRCGTYLRIREAIKQPRVG